MIKEIKIFLASLAFLTRIPVFINQNEIVSLQKFTPRYYPIAGLIIGGISGTVYMASSQLFSQAVSVFFSMVASLLITGAFHEDGLMDFADGFGGGYNKSDILRIMKDPHAGSYGVIAVVSALFMKFLILSEMNPKSMLFILMLSHSFSRFVSILPLPWMDYARDEGKASFIKERMKFHHLLFAFVGAVLPVFIYGKYSSLIILPGLFIFAVLFSLYIKNKIEGFTGDCLGALQQISEILFYILYLAINGAGWF